MKEVQTKELKAVTGGGISMTAGTLIVAGITFLIGVVDGYIRPFHCRKS